MKPSLSIVLVMTLSGLLLQSQAASASTYPLYKQCDPAWGDQLMGTPHGDGHRATICQEGCAMTSLSMALSGLGVEIPQAPSTTPETLNSWLIGHDGYKCLANDCDNLVLNAVERLTSVLSLDGESQKPTTPLGIAEALLEQTHVFIAHVHHNGHFVLLTEYDQAEDAFFVHDPFYNSTKYPYANISDIITYTIHKSELKPVDLETRPDAVIPYSYPLYKQCDKRWGQDLMVTETICQVGCLMSSTSMAIGGKGIQISGQTSDPGTLNTWLRNNDGYTQGNDLIESKVSGIDPKHISWPSDAMHPHNDIPLDKIQDMLHNGRPVIANVMKGAHFVLVIGYNSSNTDSLLVNDPGFNRQAYSYSNDVVGWRLYNITSPTYVHTPGSSLRGTTLSM